MGGVQRRPSSANEFKLNLDPADVRSPEEVSTTGVAWHLHSIPGSAPGTPGYELARNPLDSVPLEQQSPDAYRSQKGHSQRSGPSDLRGGSSGGMNARSSKKNGRSPGGADFSVEEHELVYSPEQLEDQTVRVVTREDVGGDDDGSRRFDTEEYQRLYDASRLNWRYPAMNKFRILACSIWSLSGGLTDAAPGALIPRMEIYYDINYTIVSMIWMSCAVGYIVIAVTTQLILKVIPKHFLNILGVFFQIIAYGLISSGAAFAVICVGFFFNGMGLALGLTQYNVFLSSFTNASTCLSFLHGFYGVGALIAPLIAQSMLNVGYEWNKYYYILLGIAVFNLINIFWSFRNMSKDLAEFEQADTHRMEMEQLQILHEKGADYKHTSDFVDSIKDYRTWLLCAFVFFYQGGEVSLGGWMVSFLLEERKGDAKTTGYVASGYWGGLTLGRFLLTTLMFKKLGGRRSILLLTEIIAVLLLLAWLIPNLYASATMAATSGLFVGPIYPMMVAVASHPKILPRKILTQSLLIMTSMGSSGGAIVPLIIGIISDQIGTWVLFPIVLALFQLMILCWLLLPNVDNVAGKSFWRKYIW